MTRPYEEYIARVVDRENLLVVCPDGTTREIVEQEAAARKVVAQVLLSQMKSYNNKELVIASEKKLAEYYKDWMSGKYAEIVAMETVTGDIPVKTRKEWWRVMDTVCTTPEMLLQGIEKSVVCPKQFGLAVFVDGNMARGKHKLVEAARVLADGASCNCNGDKCHSVKKTRILAITNSLSSIDNKDMLEALGITCILEPPWYKPDETLYPKGLKVEHVLVPPSPAMIQIRDCMMKALGCAKASGDDSDMWSVLRVLHVLEAHGIESFLNSYRGIYSKITDYFLPDEHPLVKAEGAAQKALKYELYHPKTDKLANIIKSTQGGVLVIAGQNDSARTIKTQLCNMGISAALLLKRDAGQMCAELKDVASKFQSGRYKALIVAKATDVYRGLLVYGDAHTVVCYVNDCNTVQSALGCGAARVVVLGTKGSDEDPSAQPLVQQDRKTRLLIEGLGRRP
ncbi:MAG: hypothetical protein F4X17_19545 [Gemmatimonadetes bacterium]|nr:hypothetical protein [Gemmatimonadota bacterium]